MLTRTFGVLTAFLGGGHFVQLALARKQKLKQKQQDSEALFGFRCKCFQKWRVKHFRSKEI